MPIQSGQIGRYGIKATPDINGPHKGIPWRSPALSNAAPTINGRTHDSTGAILGGCTVWAMSTQSDSIMGTTTSDSNGLFSLTLYTSGSFYLVSTGTVTSFSSAIPAQLSLSRASSGTYYNSSGVRATALSNVARFDYAYNGSTWAVAGLLVEEQRTNQILDSDAIAGSANWSQGGSFGLVSVTTSATHGVDGTSFLTQLGADSSNSHKITIQGGLATLGSGYGVLSVDFEKTNWNYVFLGISQSFSDVNVGAVFDLSAGTSTETHIGAGGAALLSTSVQNLGGGIYRCTLVGNSFFASSQTGVRAIVGFASAATGNTFSSDPGAPVISTFSGTETVLVGGVDFQQGTTPLSHIPTTSAQVTRSADIVSSTDATLLAADGWIVEVGEMQASAAATLLGINTIIGIGASSGNALTTTDGGTQTTGNTATWTSQNRGGLAFDSTPRVSIDLNGGTVVTAGNSPTTPTNLYFGNTNNGASGFLNAHIRMIAAYSAITDGQLPAVSTVGASLTSVLTPTFSVQWVGAASVVSGTTVNTLIPT